MIDLDKKIISLKELLSQDVEVTDIEPIDGFVLVTLKSSQDATKLGNKYGLTVFGFNTLIVNEEWMRANLVG